MNRCCFPFIASLASFALVSFAPVHAQFGGQKKGPGMQAGGMQKALRICQAGQYRECNDDKEEFYLFEHEMSSHRITHPETRTGHAREKEPCPQISNLRFGGNTDM